MGTKRIYENRRAFLRKLVQGAATVAIAGGAVSIVGVDGAWAMSLQSIDAPAAGSMIGSMLAAAAAKGDLAEIMSAALADNRITPNEAADIARACGAVQAAIVKVSQHAAASVARGPQA